MPFTVADEDKSELAVSLATLILHADSVAVTGENINKILAAANVKGVAPYWPKLFAQLLEGKDVAELLKTSGASPVGAAKVAVAESKEESKQAEESEDEEESDEGMGFSLFE
eukprot:CAMPEP_0205821686 /NCGR_PEP_ID=MMETSP0206-20130828/8909_1 /ASSEMBLY_ACC=CAM_ASM_000279 /TAXON_ID=36767 /ORGANISM="Euplotes focardii, Strain TN1" /LENGTH=111 /DNA_ID=CAMNT_0053117355 /DNA_START=33 /DNA_END=368 /DNA_ORIENTATION=+